MLGVAVLAFVFSDSNNSVVAIAVILICAALGAYALGSLGRKLSNMQAQSEANKTDFFVANRLAAALVISSVVVSFVLGIIMPAFMQEGFIGLLLTTVVNVASAWLGVLFVTRQNYLMPTHSPAAIAGWVVGVLGALIVVFYGLITLTGQSFPGGGFGVFQALLGGVVVYGSIYFFLQRAIAR